MESRAQLLSRAHSGDRDAVQQMIEENTGLIWSVARRYFGRGVDADDLYQLGCLGFLKAIEGFDERFGTQFSTYAVPKIAGEIRRFLRDDGAVKVSRGLKERAQQIHAARRRLEQTLGREPALSEIAAECGVSVEEIAEAETAAAPAESLQRESGDEGFTLEHVLGDYGQEDRVLERVALRTAIERLPEKEQQVINLRFFHGLTQSDCARGSSPYHRYRYRASNAGQWKICAPLCSELCGKNACRRKCKTPAAREHCRSKTYCPGTRRNDPNGLAVAAECIEDPSAVERLRRKQIAYRKIQRYVPAQLPPLAGKA